MNNDENIRHTEAGEHLPASPKWLERLCNGLALVGLVMVMGWGGWAILSPAAAEAGSVQDALPATAEEPSGIFSDAETLPEPAPLVTETVMPDTCVADSVSEDGLEAGQDTVAVSHPDSLVHPHHGKSVSETDKKQYTPDGNVPKQTEEEPGTGKTAGESVGPQGE